MPDSVQTHGGLSLTTHPGGSLAGLQNHGEVREAIAAGLARVDFQKLVASTDEVLRIILDDRERVGTANSVPEAIR